MLSGGRRGIDNVLTLRGGTLTMFLDKEAYERAGLVGKPDGVKGKRGGKPRWSTSRATHCWPSLADILSCRV
jgi:ribonuclease P/MRP protein subunit RPP40